ncbi:MAG: hypothetical protein GX297_03330 [Treponema sp.]|jgi:hypothetical protein|nr:hypothetical protein [Treponema sp.]
MSGKQFFNGIKYISLFPKQEKIELSLENSFAKTWNAFKTTRTNISKAIDEYKQTTTKIVEPTPRDTQSTC